MLGRRDAERIPASQLTGWGGGLIYNAFMMTLLRKLFWLALFLVFTLGFVTLFDHGYVTTQQFTTDAKSEVNDLVKLWHPAKKAPDSSDQPGK